MISNLLIEEVTDFISKLARKAVVTIDNEDIEFDIFKTVIDGGTVKKYVSISSERGLISSARLVDLNKRTLQTSDVSVTKGKDGFMIVFSIKVEIGDE